MTQREPTQCRSHACAPRAPRDAETQNVDPARPAQSSETNRLPHHDRPTGIAPDVARVDPALDVSPADTAAAALRGEAHRCGHQRSERRAEPAHGSLPLVAVSAILARRAAPP